MKTTINDRMKNPPHPGEFIRIWVIDELGISIAEAARALGVTRVALSRVLNGYAALSSEMALRIEKAFGTDMDTLVRMQASFDTANTRKRASKIRVERYRAA